MFSSRVRQQQFWPDFAKHLGKDNDIQLKEVASNDFDISIPTAGTDRPTNILLLVDQALQSQFARLESWLQQTQDDPRVIILLGLSSRNLSRALQELQLRLLEKRYLVTVLPVAFVNQLLPTIKSFASASPTIGVPCSPVQPATIMPWATTTAPRQLLTAPQVDTIQQICGSLEGLEMATRMQEGRRQLETYLGSQVARAVCEFWDDEWIA
ncbi:hypothetical protein PMZ80_006992 [Knufia obscura]|uniref:Uncharacterized protein n=2 Tax=Knufia TaxID=430999 RepID=A0AAN8IB20_9EURO|nr:hypothetical protein PMZ80_006992 [Knufia obscura]KAK5957531.1 hypothetical protein OHC33_001907 [Knufia fluminis]